MKNVFLVQQNRSVVTPTRLMFAPYVLTDPHLLPTALYYGTSLYTRLDRLGITDEFHKHVGKWVYKF